VKINPGDAVVLPAVTMPGGSDFNLDLLELEVQGQLNNGSSSGNVNADEYIHIENGLLSVIIHSHPV